MRFIAIIVSILLSLGNAFGQTRIITGKIINESFYPVYEAKVLTMDTLVWVTADTNGNFKIEIPVETKSLRVGAVGAEWKNIELLNECNHLEIILINSSTYDFMSAEKVDKLRKKEFSKLPALHQAAYNRRIFKSDTPCFIDKFIPIKKELKEILD